MIIKSAILISIAYLIQLSSQEWYYILFYSMIIGIGSNSYKQSIYLGIFVGGIPWLIEFLIKYNNAQFLLNKISIMLTVNNPIILITFSIFFISLMSTMVSLSTYHCLRIINVKK